MPAKLSQKEFIKKSNKIHGNNFGYSSCRYQNYNTKVKIRCYKHGIFKQTPDSHLQGQGCPKCKAEKIGNSNRMSQEKFIAKAIEIHGNKYNYDKIIYVGSKIKVKITCKAHGEFKISPNYLLNSKYGCPKCLSDQTGRVYKFSLDDFLKNAKDIHKKLYDYSKSTYRNSRSKIEIVCKKHGSFFQTAGEHLQGSGCPQCKTKTISFLETLWLDSQNVPRNVLNRQVSLRVGKVRYIVDGIIPSLNTVYEFNGDYYHGNPLIYNPAKTNGFTHKTFGELYQKTVEKQKNLEAHGYKVISIWESDFIKQFYSSGVFNYKNLKKKLLPNSPDPNPPFDITKRFNVKTTSI